MSNPDLDIFYDESYKDSKVAFLGIGGMNNNQIKKLIKKIEDTGYKTKRN